MKVFTASLIFVSRSRADVAFEARSRQDAQRFVKTITFEDVDEWEPFDGQVTVEEIRECVSAKKKGTK